MDRVEVLDRRHAGVRTEREDEVAGAELTVPSAVVDLDAPGPGIRAVAADHAGAGVLELVDVTAVVGVRRDPSRLIM